MGAKISLQDIIDFYFSYCFCHSTKNIMIKTENKMEEAK